jgi:rRNA maturation endonuclease Nob1
MKVIFDSGIIMNLDHLPKLQGEFYTTNYAIEEIRSSQSKNIFEIFQSQHRISVFDPEEKYVEIVESTSKFMGQIELSKTDTSVIALALMFSEQNDKVLLISDDYGLRNVAHELKIKSKGLKTKGGSQLRKFRYICTACNFEFNERVDECDNCGNQSFKRKRRE